MKKPKVYTLEIPLTPPSINLYQHFHWARKRLVKQEWTEWVWALVNQQGRKLKGCKQVHVSATIYFPRGARRDPQNYAATLYKFLDDGLVQAGVIPDDTAEYISHDEPVLTVDEHGPATLIRLEVLK